PTPTLFPYTTLFRSSSIPAQPRVRARPRPRCHGAAQTGGPSHACQPLGFCPGPLIVGIGRGAFDPDIAAFEELALPDRCEGATADRKSTRLNSSHVA